MWRSAVAGLLVGLLLVVVTGGRDDWATVTIGMAVVASLAVVIIRAVVRRDPSGGALADDL
jgi:hypothetical protein